MARREDQEQGFGGFRNVTGAFRGRSSGSGGKPPPFSPGGSSSGSRDPIGVPEDYTTPSVTNMSGMSARAAEGWASQGRGHGSIQDRPPRYFDGDEWDPAGLGPIGISELQRHMAVAGLLGEDWKVGIWDSSTADAYKSVLTEANAMGMTAEQVIQMRQQSSSMGGTGGGEGSGGGAGGTWQLDENGNPIFVEEQYVAPPLELRTTNQKDLSRAFRAAIIDTMGEGWSQAQIDEMVTAYNWKEIQVQKDAYDERVALEEAEFGAPGSTSGETVDFNEQPGGSLNIESPDTFLENQLREKDPDGYEAGQIVQDFVPAFMSMIGGWDG